MRYKTNEYSRLFGMKGFSNKLLETHFTLYHGYVEQTNQLIEKLMKMEKNPKSQEYAELNRRFGWEFNGMRLHEYYFDNLGGNGQLKQSPLSKQIDQQYGNFSEWEKDFKATSGIRGIGWCILYLDPQNEALMNVWVNEHDKGHFAGCEPILVLDAWEHAFMLDYGIDRPKYIQAFMENVRWELASERFDAAMRAVPEHA